MVWRDRPATQLRDHSRPGAAGFYTPFLPDRQLRFVCQRYQIDRLSFTLQCLYNLLLYGQNRGSSFLSGLYTGLVIGVDVDQ